MRDDAREQLKIVNEKINKAKTSLEKMEEVTTPKSLAVEFTDQLPLGQFPKEVPPPQDDDNKPHHS